MSDRAYARTYYKKKTVVAPNPNAGQKVYTATGSAGSNQYSFVVPAGIFFISAVVVSHTAQGTTTANNGAAYLECAIKRGAVSLLSTSDAIGSGVGGGNGGKRGADYLNDISSSSPHAAYLSGGGAGGYSGNGGNGGKGPSSAGGAGTGGAAGGGDGYTGNPPTAAGQKGGGVGLLGQSNSGSDAGGNGSELGAPYVGAGDVAYWGGDLRWKNNIAVTPGETLTIMLGSIVRNAAKNTGAGCRIIFGDGRTYPNNAPDVVMAGQTILSGVDTTFVVPAGVTTVCACAQQFDGGLSGSSAAAVELIVAGVTVVRAQNGNRIGTGGNGGTGGGNFGGGGAAGTYTGNGGNGGTMTSNAYGDKSGVAGTTGPGGTTGGGRNFYDPLGENGYNNNFPGESIGIKGKMPNSTYNDPVSSDSGGGAAYASYQVFNGGALSYVNDIAVTPGATLTIKAVAGRVRILWGAGRSYPNLAVDL